MNEALGKEAPSLSDTALPAEDVVAELVAAGADLADLAGQCKRLALTDVSRAVRLAHSLVSIADEGTAAQIRALGALAHALCYANRFEEALSVLNRASETARRLGDQVELATAQLALVQPLARLGRLGEAAAAAAEARRAFACAGDLVAAAMADTNWGIVARMSGEPDAALVHFERAGTGLGSDPVRRATLESNRAEALLDLDRFADAAAAFRRALRAFESAGNAHAVAIVEGNLGDLMSRCGRIGEALELFERARRRFERTDARADVARLLAEEAEALTLAGALPESLAQYAEAVQTLDAAGLPREAARARIGQGGVLLRLGRLVEAEAVLLDARGRFGVLGNDVAIAEAEFVLAGVLARLGRTDECAILLRRSGDALAARPARRCLLLLEEAGLHLDCERLAEAGNLLSQAGPLVEQLDLAPLRVRLEHTSARFRLQHGELRQALGHFLAALNQLESIRGTLQADRVRSAFVGASDDVYHDACLAGLEWGGAEGLELAFHATESTRSRVLLDIIGAGSRETQAGNAPPEDAAEFELLSEFLTCQEELNAIYDREGFGTQAPEAPPREAGRRRRQELERRLAAVELRLATTRRVRHLVARPRPLADVRESLRPDQAIICYFRAHDRLAALVIRADAAEPCLDLPRLEEVVRACRRLDLQVGRALARAASHRQDRSTARDFDAVAGSLYDLVVRPLEPALAGVHRIGVVPFGELYRVPFAALHDGERRLIERFTIEVHPSASAAMLIARREGEHEPRAFRLLAVGVADEAAPGMEAEARAIAAAVPASRLLAGADATVDRFLEEARLASVIHIATHGVYEPSSPLSARLRFADRWLTARELIRAALPGSKVVLAGCETGRSSSDTGEERYGLIRSLLAAGASEILGSHWSLHDATARELFVRLHRILSDPQRGRSGLGEALRIAQIDAFRSGTPPVYWSGLFAAGGE